VSRPISRSILLRPRYAALSKPGGTVRNFVCGRPLWIRRCFPLARRNEPRIPDAILERLRAGADPKTAIEALNATLCRAVCARGHFPTDEAALTLLYLVLNRFEKAWTMDRREWVMAKVQFAVMVGERFTRAMAA
jgi:hypothetical protein